MSPRAGGVTGLAVAGAALTAVVASRYPVLVYGDRCDVWPPLQTNLAYGAVYLAGLALLTFAWLRATDLQLSPRRILGLAAIVHAVAFIGPPFLSNDVLFYTAIGRAMATFHQSPYHPLNQSLPASDPLLPLLPAHWVNGTSAYWYGFNQLSALIGHLAGERMWLHLRLYQLVGMGAILSTAWVAGLAAGQEGGPKARARAVALVAFCPLGVIEATQNGHNDALLALGVAGYAWLTVQRRGGAGLLALCTGLVVKASALILLGMEVVRAAVSRTRAELTPARLAAAGVLLLALLAALFFYVVARSPRLASFAFLVGSPGDPYERCTRAYECLPRGILRYVANQPYAAWAVGLAFRGAGALWLLYAAARAARADRPLTWMATGIYIYYLFFHGFMQSWYLLSLLPLLPFAAPALLPSMKLFLIALVAYYPLDLIFHCAQPAGIAAKEFLEAFSTAFIPGLVLLLRLRRARRLARA